MAFHICNKIPENWIIEWDDDKWNCYNELSPQESGVNDLFYCPWCGAELELDD